MADSRGNPTGRESNPRPEEEERKYKNAVPCPIAALPDELLVAVFSLLGDGAALLDTLPLVCRRWRRPCRDSKAWRNVEVRVDVQYENGVPLAPSGPTAAARIVLHAPALRSLDLQGPDGSLERALRRSKAVVRRLSVREAFWKAAAGGRCPAALDLLWRSRRGLRGLALWLDDACPQHDSEQRAALDMLADMQALEELRLDVAEGLPYAAGRLAAGLPRLRQLYVSHVRFTDAYSSEPFEPPEALVEDVLGAAAASLRDASLYWNRPPSAAQVAALARCADLDTLMVHAAALPSLANWPRLHTLSVQLYPAEAAEVGASVRDALRLCEAHDPLRHLTLGVNCYIDDDLWEESSDECKGHVDAFLKLRPAVELQLDGWY